MGQCKKIIGVEITSSVLDERGQYVRDDIHEWNSSDETISLSQEQLQDVLNVVLEFVNLPANMNGARIPKTP